MTTKEKSTNGGWIQNSNLLFRLFESIKFSSKSWRNNQKLVKLPEFIRNLFEANDLIQNVIRNFIKF